MVGVDRDVFFFFFQAEDGIRDLVRSRGLGDVYKRQNWYRPTTRGMEARIGEKLAHLRALDEAAGGKAGGAGRSARADDQS